MEGILIISMPSIIMFFFYTLEDNVIMLKKQHGVK